MFHTGCHHPERAPRLEGGGETARYMKFHDITGVETARKDLESIVAAWCDSH
jgi:hypothetical protein